MSFDFGSLEKKPDTTKTTKPSTGMHKSVSSGKPETQVPSFDFLNSGEKKTQATKPLNITTQQPKPQAKPQPKPQEVKPRLAVPVKPSPATINLQSEPKPTAKPVVSVGTPTTSKPTPKPVPKPTPTPVKQAKQEQSTSAPAFNFGSVGTSSTKTSTKSPSKPTPKSAHTSSHGSKDRRKGKRSSSPLDALKDLNPMALYGGIGGIVVLLVVIVCLCMGGGGEKKAKTTKPTKSERRMALDAAIEYNNRGEYEKAIAEFEKAYKLDPTDNYAPDQISIIYRNNLHDEAQAEHWKSISDRNQTGNLEDMEGASARVYAERAAKKKARQGKR